VCIFCTEHIPWVDYKDMNLLRRFMSDRGKIKSRANTGTCSQHQHDVALAIKNARELALLPYAVRTLAGDKSAGRRGRGPGRPGERPQGDRPSGPPSAAGGAEAAVSIDSDIPVSEETASVDADVLGAGTAPDDGGSVDADATTNDELQD